MGRAASGPNDAATGSRRSAAALAGLLVALAIVAVWGRVLDNADPRMLISASPWAGHYRLVETGQWRWLRLVPAIVLGGSLVAWWPAWCRRLPARWLGLVAGLVGVSWALALQATRGWAVVSRPMAHPAEYLSAIDQVRSLGLGPFLRTFVERIGDYPIHVQGHPPGQVVLLWSLDRLGLGGPGPAAALSFAAQLAATVGVLQVVRWEAGDAVLLRAALFVGLTPAVVWGATSTDPVFGALCVAAVVLAFQADRKRGGTSLAAAAGSGLVAGVAVFFTYAAPLFLAPTLVPLGRLVGRRRWSALAVAVGSGLAVIAVAGLSGFTLWDGLAATTEAYRSGVAAHRPYRFFVVANLVVLGVAVGPAVVAGTVRGGHAQLAPVLMAAALGVAVADLTGLSKGEVERIWLPFTPWLALAAVPLVGPGERHARGWLAAQLLTASAVQFVLRSPW